MTCPDCDSAIEPTRNGRHTCQQCKTVLLVSLLFATVRPVTEGERSNPLADIKPDREPYIKPDSNGRMMVDCIACGQRVRYVDSIYGTIPHRPVRRTKDRVWYQRTESGFEAVTEQERYTIRNQDGSPVMSRTRGFICHPCAMEPSVKLGDELGRRVPPDERLDDSTGLVYDDQGPDGATLRQVKRTTRRMERF
jgi:hypothetical protein